MYLVIFLADDAAAARRAAGTRLDGETPPFAGSPAQLVDYLGGLVEQGFDAWQLIFPDFPDTTDLELFLERVLPAFR